MSTEHDCVFMTFKDWEGDPDLPNGKRFIYETKCYICGEPPEPNCDCPICGAEINEYSCCNCFAEIHYGKD